MADQRLTDKTEKTTGFDSNDISHLVDTDNTLQHVTGSSFWFKHINLLAELGVRKILGCIVVKFNGTPDNTLIQSDDWVFWMAGGGQDRLVIGIATDNITSVPADLDDTSKFDKYHESEKLLP